MANVTVKVERAFYGTDGKVLPVGKIVDIPAVFARSMISFGRASPATAEPTKPDAPIVKTKE